MSSGPAATLNPALVPDRDAGYRLSGVYERVVDGCRDELVLAFDGAALVFRADPDTDALDPQFVGDGFGPSSDHRPLTGSAVDRFVGAELGWTWLAVNQQGYTDTALLSFAGVVPAVAVHVIGSSVRVLGLTPAA